MAFLFVLSVGLLAGTISGIVGTGSSSMAVGHVRYSTTGATILRNVQPLFAELNAGGFAVGHNGNLTNGLTLRRQLVREGAMRRVTAAGNLLRPARPIP